MTQEQQDEQQTLTKEEDMRTTLGIHETPPQPADPMLQLIDKLASNPEVDIAKMQAIVEMRNQEIARQSAKAFAADYVLMKAELPLVIKDKNNAQTKSKYAALENINMQIDPVLQKYGFATSTPIKAQTETHVTVQAILRHREGHFETTEITLPIDDKGMAGSVNKTRVHGISSSITYAKRVAVCALLNISTGDDNDGNKPQDDAATFDQKAAIGKLYTQLTSEQKIKFDTQIGGVADIKKCDVDTIVARLNKSIKEQK